jgi:hypothetical protein
MPVLHIKSFGVTIQKMIKIRIKYHEIIAINKDVSTHFNKRISLFY